MRIPSLLACVLATACLSAGAQSLKPGLWEINNKMNNPQMEQAMQQMQAQLAAMSPEQRKQMENMLAQRGVRMAPGSGGMAVQMCMTPEMTERNELPVQEGCRMTRQERTGNRLNLAFTCANPPSSGEGLVTIASPESYSSRMTVRSTIPGQPAQSATIEATGKWVQADCGNVRPMPPARN